MSDILIREMRLSDLSGVLEVERDSFALPWSEQSFRDEIEKNPLSTYLVAVKGDAVLGYVGAWKILDEGHITNIAVKKSHRGRGIGELLLSNLIDEFAKESIASITLEVRVSNVPAQNLYKKLGFLSAGTRPNYYEDNREDALIMWYRR